MARSRLLAAASLLNATSRGSAAKIVLLLTVFTALQINLAWSAPPRVYFDSRLVISSKAGREARSENLPRPGSSES